MYVTPYYNKTSQKGLVAHYKKLAFEVELPLIIYNIQGRTGLNMLPKTFRELAGVENIAAVKEASGNIVQVAEIAELCGDMLDIYSGNDDYVVPILSLGGKGVISTAGKIIPRAVHEMVQKFLDGDVAGSRRIQLDILPLVRSLFNDVNPMPVKAALNLLGFAMGACRMPLTTLDNGVLEELKKQMTAFGLAVT
jgi:4-hydroxy-tetrahydrodipicolinate synthase